MKDDTIETAIWSAVEPILGIVGACLPLMAPLFRKLHEMSTKKSSTGASSGGGWNSKRLEGGQKAASQPAWHKDNTDLENHKETVPFTMHKEDIALTSQKEWVDGDGSDSEKRQSSVEPEFVIRAPPRTFYG